VENASGRCLITARIWQAGWALESKATASSKISSLNNASYYILLLEYQSFTVGLPRPQTPRRQIISSPIFPTLFPNACRRNPTNHPKHPKTPTRQIYLLHSLSPSGKSLHGCRGIRLAQMKRYTYNILACRPSRKSSSGG